jgi:ubiquinone/menaquinone biosynthesis C-methylase UbiE
MFKTRSQKPERIDTGDYTAAEYDQFLIDIRLVNRFAGDNRALKNTLLREIESDDLQDFSVLDVGAGSGELLRVISKFAAKQNRIVRLIGLELNPRSAQAILEESQNYPAIRAIRSDALNLPFSDNSFDFVICSLFTHHLSDDQIIHSLSEMSRVSRRNLFVIDLHRHPLAYAFYKVFCMTFRISRLVREDGSLSILRSFKPNELQRLAKMANLKSPTVERHFPFRVVLKDR